MDEPSGRGSDCASDAAAEAADRVGSPTSRHEASAASAAASQTIASKRASVRSNLLARSRTIQSPNFLRASENDLKLLFDLYDQHFFAGTLAAAHRAATTKPLAFEWSGRLRSSGGVTTRLKDRLGGLRFKITFSRPLIFDNFKNTQPHIVVGVACTDRLDALMRIFEHELLHLHEFLAFGQSNCARPRFQRLALQHFGHAEHKHRLTTPRERALKSTTLRPGMTVAFSVDGEERRGRINRINARATVLVPDAKGRRYTDGKRYLKYYVPLGLLKEST